MDEIFNNPKLESHSTNQYNPPKISQKSGQYYPPNSTNSNFRTNNKIHDTLTNKIKSLSPHKNKNDSKNYALNYINIIIETNK